MRAALQGLAQGGATCAALSQLSGGLPLAVPLRSLALALAYSDGAMGLATAATHAAMASLGAAGEETAEQGEPIIDPLLLQACRQQLEAAWVRAGTATSEGLRRYVSSGMLAPHRAEARPLRADSAGMLGAYLQLQGVPAAVLLQQTAGQVQAVLRDARPHDAAAAATAAAAMLTSRHQGMALPAAHAIAVSLLH